MSAAYATGLPGSEVSGLKVTDIDSKCITLRVEQGKGGKDPDSMLPPLLLERLAVPGMNLANPLTAGQLKRCICPMWRLRGAILGSGGRFNPPFTLSCLHTL